MLLIILFSKLDEEQNEEAKWEAVKKQKAKTTKKVKSYQMKLYSKSQWW